MEGATVQSGEPVKRGARSCQQGGRPSKTMIHELIGNRWGMKMSAKEDNMETVRWKTIVSSRESRWSSRLHKREEREKDMEELQAIGGSSTKHLGANPVVKGSQTTPTQDRAPSSETICFSPFFIESLIIRRF